MTEPNLLTVQGLSKSYALNTGFWSSAEGSIRAVDRVSFCIERGRTFGLVGESGSGKTTIGRMVLRVIEPDEGTILFSGADSETVDLARMKPSQIRPLRHKIQMIFQDPYSSLDPRMTVARIIGEPLVHIHDIARNEIQDRIVEAVQHVGLRREYLDRYPHAFSGGQRQRIGIARALVSSPELVVADEAVSALDVSVQAQILNLLRELQQKLGITYLFIAHDLGVVRYLCDTIAVLYRGRIVETAEKRALFQSPRHPYTESLIAAAPRPDPRATTAHPRAVPPHEQLTSTTGCPYYSRCSYRQEICVVEEPELREIVPGQFAACHFDLNLKGA